MADKDTLQDAIELFEESEDATSAVREHFHDDTEFARLSDQWPEEVLKQRKAEGRPALTINRLPAAIRQVVNDGRQAKPGIKISPVDGGADEDTAKVIGGLIRHIERASSADIAYDTALDHAVSGGFGFLRVSIDYAHADSFDLEARIDRVPNPLMVHWDPGTTRFDAADWEYAFVSEMLSKRDFEARYPDAQAVDFGGDARDATRYWATDDTVRVAEYWRRTRSERRLLGFPDGRAMRAGEVIKMAEAALAAIGDDGRYSDDEKLGYAFANLLGMAPNRERMAEFHEVKRHIVTGAEVLDEEAWPGSTIPICPVWGEEVYQDGERHFRSMIRDAKDPQRMFNFWRSATTELVALAPRAPWVGPEGFVPQGKEAIWQSANTRSHAYLEWDPDAGPPTRQPFASIPTGAMQEALSATDDIKAITGIYDASLGARGNETSGRAILARQREGDVANFHFIDNLNRAIEYAGRVLVDIIPAVYSPGRTIRILGEDMREDVVQLVAETQTGEGAQEGPNGGPRLYNVSTGRYDVTVETGPSFETQRVEARETLIEIMRAVPGAAQFVGDVLLDNMDFVGADKIAKRLQHLLPPQVQADEGIGPPQAGPQGIPPGAVPGGAPPGGPGPI